MLRLKSKSYFSERLSVYATSVYAILNLMQSVLEISSHVDLRGLVMQTRVTFPRLFIHSKAGVRYGLPYQLGPI